MFDKTIVQESLRGLVGWRQPFNSDYAFLTAPNLESRSGKFVNDIPYATIQGLHQTQVFAGITEAQFNEYLSNQQDAAINSVCSAVFDKPDFIERHLAYEYPMNKVDSTLFPESFVGLKIELKRDNNLAIKIPSVVLDFATDGNIKLLLFSSEKPDAPLFSEDVVINSRRQKVNVNWVINNTNDNYKGNLYLGYLANGVDTPQPYKRNWNASNIIADFTNLCVESIKVDGHNTETLFDQDDSDGLSDYAGLNPDILVYDDFTEWITSNQDLFSEAIYLSMAIWALSTYASSLRSNKDQRQTDDLVYRKILVQIEGNNEKGSLKVEGFKPMLSARISSIKKEIHKLQQNYEPDGPYVYTQT